MQLLSSWSSREKPARCLGAIQGSQQACGATAVWLQQPTAVFLVAAVPAVGYIGAHANQPPP
jgi:hypothetical protein